MESNSNRYQHRQYDIREVDFCNYVDAICNAEWV
jgi:hypothetical protein